MRCPMIALVPLGYNDRPRSAGPNLFGQQPVE